jgi:hypothetical protein
MSVGASARRMSQAGLDGTKEGPDLFREMAGELLASKDFAFLPMHERIYVENAEHGLLS